ncbi:MAG TPA: phosphoenolpyruvate--protein phosphotransferase [Planctomycetota bacterium]|nr:phosphoenolpyruvate--protein phosphotransferase [Planctomycetota bacterium]
METKKGIPVSPGICIGDVVVMGQEDLQIRRRSITGSQAGEEVERFDQAVLQAVREINEEISKFGDDLKITRQVLESHRDMIADPTLRKEVVHRVEENRNTAEYALSLVLRGYYHRFEEMESEYISERAHDVADIEKKLLRALLGKEITRQTKHSKSTVIVGHNLTPGETASLDRKHVKGFAIDVGGRTSHTAIMARAMQIPAVVGLEDISTFVSGGEKVIIDGYTGLVIIDPDRRTLEAYRKKAESSKEFYQQLRGEIRLPAETIDAFEISIAANIELPDEIHTALEWGARGIGLYRTEFLYDGGKPDEEKHFRTYRSAVGQLGGKYLVIRTLDAGADKFHSESVGHSEANPFLGCRSIRLCFLHPELFRAQLRAVLRVSSLGPVRIMLPMVSGLDELRRAKGIIADVQDELSREGVHFAPHIPLGIMVEVPSTALMADLFAKEVDFFSIGTNDLVQYCLAVDRVNERVAHLYKPAHPAILRLITAVIDAGHRQGIDVSICGEMSSEPIYTILLLGLGLRSFSVSPISIPTVKRLIRQVNMRDAAEVARTCLRYETAEECQEFLAARVKHLLPDFS